MMSGISAEDLELLRTSDEDIRLRNSNFCFDRTKLEVRMAQGEAWQHLVQGHLYFEHVIDNLLRGELVDHDAIQFNRMGFSQRLSLVEALGLLPKALFPPIKVVSRLRNKLAHDLSFEINESDVSDLKNCIPNELMEVICKAERKTRSEINLSKLIELLIYQIDIFRQNRAAAREISRKSLVRLQTVLDKTPGAVYVP